MLLSYKHPSNHNVWSILKNCLSNNQNNNSRELKLSSVSIQVSKEASRQNYQAILGGKHLWWENGMAVRGGWEIRPKRRSSLCERGRGEKKVECLDCSALRIFEKQMESLSVNSLFREAHVSQKGPVVVSSPCSVTGQSQPRELWPQWECSGGFQSSWDWGSLQSKIREAHLHKWLREQK